MSSKLKTLIFFDTNNLRHTLGDLPFYADFKFGKPYQTVVDFINENQLHDYVEVAVSKMAIEELKNQKHKAYKKDVEDFTNLNQRLKELPHLKEALPDLKYEDVDIEAYVKKKTEEYIKNNDITVVSYKPEESHEVLENMISKVIDTDKVKSPFKNAGNGKRDAGFKDNVIWESFMRYERLTEFDKVIFLSKDGGFDKYCKREFESTQNKFVSIMKEPQEVVEELKGDYENYIEERDFHEWAEQDVFRSYLNNELMYKSSILIEGKEYPIYNYKIVDYCEEVNNNSYIDQEGNDVEEYLIQSRIFIKTKIEEEKQDIEVYASTLLEKEFTIVDIAFDPDLV